MTRRPATTVVAVTSTMIAGLLAFAGAPAAGPVPPADGTELYLPSPDAWARWQVVRDETLDGSRQAHIAVLGDSMVYGSGNGNGVSVPKPAHNWVGQLRRRLDARLGSAGTGIVFCEHGKLGNPSWDPRWSFAGGIGPYGAGLFRRTGCHLPPGAIVGFTAVAETFVTYTYGLAGLNQVGVDGGPLRTIDNEYAGGPVPELAPAPGYPFGHLVTRVRAGAAGEHDLAIVPDPAAGAVLYAVEAHVDAPGTFRITEAAANGALLWRLTEPDYNDDVSAVFGLAYVDAMRADLLVVALGFNDWNTNAPVADTKARLQMLVRRQRSTGDGHAGGGVLLVWNPAPDFDLLGGSEERWRAYRAMFYAVARAEDVPLLDLGSLWTGDPTGLISADGVHPNDAGARLVALAVEQALFAEPTK